MILCKSFLHPWVASYQVGARTQSFDLDQHGCRRVKRNAQQLPDKTVLYESSLVLWCCCTAFDEKHAHNDQQTPDILVALWADPIIVVLQCASCFLHLLASRQQPDKLARVLHFGEVHLIGDVEPYEICQ